VCLATEDPQARGETTLSLLKIRHLAAWNRHANLAARDLLPGVFGCRPIGHRRESGTKPGTRFASRDCVESLERLEEGTMTYTASIRYLFSGIGRFVEHAAAVIIGFVMMVVGLALGVTMIMLPVGVVVGLIGVALFVGGLFAHIDDR
jgi:hypothetical protein